MKPPDEHGREGTAPSPPKTVHDKAGSVIFGATAVRRHELELGIVTVTVLVIFAHHWQAASIKHHPPRFLCLPLVRWWVVWELFYSKAFHRLWKKNLNLHSVCILYYYPRCRTRSTNPIIPSLRPTTTLEHSDCSFIVRVNVLCD